MRYTYERDVDINVSSTLVWFLLVVLRDMLAANPTLRFILMSATINTTLFSSCFNDCLVLKVEGQVRTYVCRRRRRAHFEEDGGDEVCNNNYYSRTLLIWLPNKIQK